MTWNRHAAAPYRARRIIAELTDRGITLPKPVAAAVAELDRVEAEQIGEPEHHAVRDAILAGASRAELNVLLLDQLGAQHLRGSYEQAKVVAAGNVLQAVLVARDELHPQLAELAGAAIATLEKVATIPADTSLDALVRSGRHEQARAYADRELVAAELAKLYEIRDHWLTPGGPDGGRVEPVDATQWADPRVVTNRLHGTTVAEVYVAGLRAGGTLWFPTAEEAVEAASPIYEAWKAGAERAAAAQRGVGSTVAWA